MSKSMQCSQTFGSGSKIRKSETRRFRIGTPKTCFGIDGIQSIRAVPVLILSLLARSLTFLALPFPNTKMSLFSCSMITVLLVVFL